MPQDYVDRVVSSWRQRDLDLDVASLEIVGRLLRAAAYVEKVRETALASHGLSVGDYDVLSTLLRVDGGEGVNPKHLCGSSLITSGSMTARLDRLEAAGLVERRRDPVDRRGVRVRLTQSGLAAVGRAVIEVLEAHERFLAPLNGNERERSAEALRKLLLGSGDA